MIKRFITSIITVIFLITVHAVARAEIIPVTQNIYEPTEVKTPPRRMPSRHIPYVTIDDSDVLRVYDEYTDDITVLVCDSNDNPVWSGYPSSSNQQCHEFSITGLDNGQCYTLYLYIDGVTYTGEFTK